VILPDAISGTLRHHERSLQVLFAMETETSVSETRVCLTLGHGASRFLGGIQAWWQKWQLLRVWWLVLVVCAISETLLVGFYSIQQVRKATLLGVSVRKLFPALMILTPLLSLGLYYLVGSESNESARALLDAGTSYLLLTTESPRRGFLWTHRGKASAFFVCAGIALILAGVLLVASNWRRRTRDYVDIARQHVPRLFADSGTDDICGRGLPIRILSYNVCVRPPGVSGSTGDDLKDERLKLLLPELVQFDVICFQELFDAYSNRREALKMALKQYGLRHHAYIPRRVLPLPPKFVDGGVSIFSRFPIIEFDYIHYKHVVYHTIDALVGKGVLYARVELPVYWPQDWRSTWNASRFPKNTVCARELETQQRARYLHVFSTHMQAGDRPGYEPEEYHAAVRFRQAEEMRDFVLRKVADDDGPILITGDFNINARISPGDARESSWYRELMRRLGSAAPNGAALRVCDLLSHSHGGMHPITDDGKCIDYLLFDPRRGAVVAHGDEDHAVRVYRYTVPQAARTRIFPEKDFSLSDHSAVLGTLRMPVSLPSR
jgi:sphingomyelin phosphodiesterase